MPAIRATAPGKIILFGEHAVVYGQPAIAAPVTQVQAVATVIANPKAPNGQVFIQSDAVELNTTLESLPTEHPLAATVQLVMTKMGLSSLPSLTLRISSTIPVAAGLGSGAAVSIAIIRALSGFLGHPLADDQVNQIAFQIEKIHHGTPSGIDNTVITTGMPVYFIKGQPIQTFQVSRPFDILIADTGVPSPTSETVAAVKRFWQVNPKDMEEKLAAMGTIAMQARQFIESGNPSALAPLMNQNHTLLQQISVSSPELDHLINAALQAGAWGAKLSGGGGGGNMIALAAPEQLPQIAEKLKASGATRTIITRIS